MTAKRKVVQKTNLADKSITVNGDVLEIRSSLYGYVISFELNEELRAMLRSL